MLKKFLALAAMLYAAASFAAVDVNKATAADLDGIKGVGPSLSTRILDERKKGNFKDWNDFIERTRGVGEGNAAKFSNEGLTVNGDAFKGAAATTQKDDKAHAKEERKARAEAKKHKADEAKSETKSDSKSEKAMAKDAAKEVKAEAVKPAAAATGTDKK